MARVIVILLPVIVIAVFAVLALVIYFAVYKRRINQTVVEDKPMKKPMTEPKNVAYILLIIAGVVVILSSMRAILFYVPSSSNISDLQARINNLEQRINDLEEIQNMNNFDDDNDQESSLIESAEATVVDYNIKTQKAAVKFNVMLKSAADNTRVSVSVDKKEFELKKSGSTVYEGTCDIDIFEDYSYVTYIIITDGKTSKAESGEEFMLEELYTQCLPSISKAETQYGKENKASYGKYHLDVSYDIEAEEFNKIKFKRGTFKLVLYKNDVLIAEKNVPDVGSGQAIGLNEEFDFSQGDSIYVFLFAEDTAGFIHKIKLSSWEDLYRNGDASVEQDFYESNTDTILDKKGNTLVTYDDVDDED